jgi:ADP-ribose pyrophosphatase YjhB (NUDIX family)
MEHDPTRKVIAYITRGEKLLVFRHPHHPEAGIQIPAGTVNFDESLEDAVVREAQEETGLSRFEIHAFLGVQDQDLTAWGKEEIHRRYFYHLIYDGQAPDTWQHYEIDPSEGNQDSILFEFFWVSYPDEVPDLIAEQGTFLGQIKV